MKKILLITASAAFVLSTFSSCKKCTTCKYTWVDPNGSSQTYTYPEACGNKKDIEAYEAAAKAAAAAYNNSQVNCN